MTERDTDFARFVAGLRRRLEAGARTYGNVSFRRPAVELIDELQDEVSDIAGWGWILWRRLDWLRADVERLGNLEVRMRDRRVRVLSWVPGSRSDEREGLLGWTSIQLGSFIVDNIALRRTSRGRFTLSFPTRTSKSGVKHSIVRPLDDESRVAVEKEIFAQLGQREGFSLEDWA